MYQPEIVTTILFVSPLLYISILSLIPQHGHIFGNVSGIGQSKYNIYTVQELHSSRILLVNITTIVHDFNICINLPSYHGEIEIVYNM